MSSSQLSVCKGRDTPGLSCFQFLMNCWMQDLPDDVCVCILGRGLDDLMTVNLARYKPTGEHIAIRRIDLESCTNDMVTYLQVCIISSLCHDSASLFPFRCITGEYLCNPCVSSYQPPPISNYTRNHCFLSASLLGLKGCNLLFSASQGELHVSKLFHHHSILPYKSVFIAENELWVITPFMAYGKK